MNVFAVAVNKRDALRSQCGLRMKAKHTNNGRTACAFSTKWLEKRSPAPNKVCLPVCAAHCRISERDGRAGCACVRPARVFGGGRASAASRPRGQTRSVSLGEPAETAGEAVGLRLWFGPVRGEPESAHFQPAYHPLPPPRGHQFQSVAATSRAPPPPLEDSQLAGRPND